MDQKKIIRCSTLVILISAGLANGDGSDARVREFALKARPVRYKPPAPQGNRMTAYNAPLSAAPPGARKPSTKA
ncbi:hypothetical protein SUGI_0971020 [Cryptomeria japonica]|nr:hypothetical protein SUGI_0971020 [Cryptomeria japonica]